MIAAHALTVHKAQGLTKSYILFVANSSLFARALTYVALSRCKSLAGLYIVGAQIATKHFRQVYGKDDSVIKCETSRLRRFQGNTIRAGLRAAKLYVANNDTNDINDASHIELQFPRDELEFDDSV